MDFGLLPPEINSGRMYSGPGSGPMLAAAAAWDGLAGELSSTASSYQSVIEGLINGAWHGPTAMSMAAASAPYVTWVGASAAQAEQTATQARAAAAAYETAFAATVPPPVIAANRALLMSLIATNILGQNTPAIAATEFHYAEMWAQDTAAMYGYAGSSAAASQLTPFAEPPQTTNPGGLTAQSTTVAQAVGSASGTNAQSTLSQLISTVPATLQNLTSPVTSAAPAQASLSSFLNFITGPTSPISYYPIAGVPYLLGFQNVLLPMAGENLSGALAKASMAPAAPSALLADELGSSTSALSATGVGPTVSAGLGQAGLVGKLSVPQSWASAAPAIKPAAFVLPSSSLGAAPAAMADGSGSLFSQTALSGLAGRALAGTGSGVVRSAGASPGVSIGGDAATTATIIVIPADE